MFITEEKLKKLSKLSRIEIKDSEFNKYMELIDKDLNDVKDVFLGTINPDTSCDHEWYAADCKTPKTCGKCGEMEGEKLGHTTENGTCDRCGKVIGDSSKPVE